MFKISMLSVVTAIAIAACLLSSDVSHAGAPASTGYAVPHQDSDCFTYFAGTVTNVCTTTKEWHISDNITKGGVHTTLVTAFRPNGGTFFCRVCATPKEGGFFQCSALIPLTTVDTDAQFSLGDVGVPAFGGMFVACVMGPNARFDSANF